METAFDIKKGVWDISWPGRVSQYDVVYHRPPFDPLHGMPVGNGEIGVLCWCEESRIIMAVNRSDLWDDNPDGHFTAWSAEIVERGTTLRHACRIVIDFGVPIFSDLYPGKCDSRLSISDASSVLDVAGPFGGIKCRIFVDDNNAICCEISKSLKEDLPTRITFERYGSRNYAHWYCEEHTGMPGGLVGTKSAVSENTMYLSHKLTCGTFCAAMRVENAEIKKFGSRACVAEMKKKRFSIIATVTEPLKEGARQTADELLDILEDKGIVRLFGEHKKVWKKFWLRSFMDFGDEYLNNIWHLTMFYARASQRGNYPGRFINGAWAWARDVQPWGFYYHWNQQQTYWPLNAAGHHDLLDSYLNFRFNALDVSKDAARKFHDCEGAYVSDITDRRGYCSDMEMKNHTPVAQIAQQMWDQYLFTQDKKFLEEKALPYMVEAAVFFANLFTKGKDGKYHTKGGTGYEGGRIMKDAATELSAARTLFSSVIEALKITAREHPQSDQWLDILENMADYLTIDAEEAGFVEKAGKGWKLATGMFKGTSAESSQVISSGFETQAKKKATSLVRTEGNECKIAAEYNLAGSDGIFPMMELSVLFPSNSLGLGQKDTELFKMMSTLVKAYAFCDIGWAPMPVALARLGLGNELQQTWKQWIENFQWFCNGWGQYAGRNFAEKNSGYNADNRFGENILGDLAVKVPGGYQLVRMNNWMFRHMGTESLSVMTTAMNEGLLQSQEGVIRVAPAVGKKQNARFTLHARGGFQVSAQVEKTEVKWIVIKSINGQPCRIANPWPDGYVFENGKKVLCCKKDIIEFATSRNGVYSILPSESVLKKWKTLTEQAESSVRPKRFSDLVCIGIERVIEKENKC